MTDIKKGRGDSIRYSLHSLRPYELPIVVETSNSDTTPIQRQISCNKQNDKKTRVNTNIYSI